MAIYHLKAKIVSRGVGRSAVAAAAYMSCSQIYNDYDGVQHDYTRKQGLVWEQIFLPPMAPREWQDRAALWNAVEETEKTKDSRLAREFVIALPVELSKADNISLLTDFIQNSFISDGMCADVAIHDTDGHNPHAHILLTVRPLNEDGSWQYKTEKEYLCIRNGEEKGFTAAEYKTAQNDGWEKQYQYKVGKKKEYMTPSAAEAQGYARTSKYPKSTKFGRQNPITERWNSEEQLVLWRKAWAETANRYLERSGIQEQIDHRSHIERGITEQPTIHEGVVARALESKGIISDRCEINRQIKADNRLLRELKAQVKTLIQAVKNTIPAIAEAMEGLRSKMIIFRYQLLHIGMGKSSLSKSLKALRPEYERYMELAKAIKETSRERKDLLVQKKETPVWKIPVQMDLSRRIAELTEKLEELRSEKAMLLSSLEYPEGTGTEAIQKDISTMEAGLQQLEQQETKYSAELQNAVDDYKGLQEQAAEFNPAELYKAREALRPEREAAAVSMVQSAYGDKYNHWLMFDSKRDVSEMLGDEKAEHSVRERLHKLQQEQCQKENAERPHKPKNKDWER